MHSSRFSRMQNLERAQHTFTHSLTRSGRKFHFAKVENFSRKIRGKYPNWPILMDGMVHICIKILKFNFNTKKERKFK